MLRRRAECRRNEGVFLIERGQCSFKPARACMIVSTGIWRSSDLATLPYKKRWARYHPSRER